MRLTNKTLRGILVAIYNVDEKYIVPKQGNWYNPQVVDVEKPSTWIAYLLLYNRPISKNDYEMATKIVDKLSVDISVIKNIKIADIDLQFVGDEAEELANDVSFWIERKTVEEQFATVNGVLMATEMGVRTSPFIQEGLNSILSFNVRIKVAWIDVVETSQTAVLTATIGGKINV